MKPAVLGSRGKVTQRVQSKDVGGWSWRRRVDNCLWSRERVQQTYSLLELVGEWPGASVNFARQLLGVASGTNWLKNHFRRLEEDGFLERVPVGSEYCYQLTRRGLLQMAARDRVYWKAVGMSSFIDDWKLTVHELGVMKVIGGSVRPACLLCAAGGPGSRSRGAPASGRMPWSGWSRVPMAPGGTILSTSGGPGAGSGWSGS